MTVNRISERIGRIISGGFYAALEAVEEATPDLIMKQAIKEADEAILEVKAELGAVIAERHQANKMMASISDKHTVLGDQIAIALDQGRDDLAAVAVKKQLELEAMLPDWEARLQTAEEAMRELENYIDQLEGKRADMKNELHDFLEVQKDQQAENVMNTGGGINGLHKANQKMDRAVSAFDRAGGSYHAGSGDDASLKELEKLVADAAVQNRLEKLKAERG